MGVAKSSYYYELNKKDWIARYEHLKKELTDIVDKHPGYGYRRIQAELKRRGYIINHKVLRKLLRAWKLAIKRKTRRAKSGIQKILDGFGESVNVIRGISCPTPFQVICCDVTEIVYGSGKVYLAACLDINTKRLLGWTIDKSPRISLVIGAYRKARRYLKKINVDLSKVIFHSDQGSVYTSYSYVTALVKDLVTLSYSRKGTPADNPEVESFFGRLKEEWGDVFADAKTEKEVIALINEAISYYNGERLHSTFDYMTPDEYVASQFKTVAYA